MNKEAKIIAITGENQGTKIEIQGNDLDIGLLLSEVIKQVANADDRMTFSAIVSGIYRSKNKDGLCYNLVRVLKKGGFIND